MKGHADLLSFPDAISMVANKGERRSIAFRAEWEELPLLKARGRILAENLVSGENVPAFDNSQMDGFLLESATIEQASREHPIALLLRGSLAAGDFCAELKPGGAYEIMTGACIAEGSYDCVLKVEDAILEDRPDGRYLIVREKIEAGHYVRPKACDFEKGQAIAVRGATVTPEIIMACASLGISELKLVRPVRIALLTTGKELQHHNEKNLTIGSIRDSSGPYLQSLLDDPRFDLVLHKLIPDDPNIFIHELRRCRELQVDVIMSTGAVSMGKHDFVKECLLNEGANVLFHKVAMRPGKPILFAEWPENNNSPVFFGLPGNPISTLVGWRFFVDFYLRSLIGQGMEEPGTACLTHSMPKPEGMSCVFKAFVENGEGERQVKILEGQGSHLISPLLKANCWAVLPGASTLLEAGESISIFPLHAHEGATLI